MPVTVGCAHWQLQALVARALLPLGCGFQAFTPAGSSYYGGFTVEVDRVRDVVREAAAA